MPPRIGIKRNAIKNKDNITFPIEKCKGFKAIYFLKNFLYSQIKKIHNTRKMINNKNSGEEDTVAAISFGDLKYCNGVASILYPHAVYNSRSAVIKNEIRIITTIV